MLTLEYLIANVVLYVLIRYPTTGHYWTGTGNNSEAWNPAHRTGYVGAVGTTDATGFFSQAFPAAITTPGVYTGLFFRKTGATPDPGDPPGSVDEAVGEFTIVWNGTAEVTLLNITGGGGGDVGAPGSVAVTFRIRDADAAPVPGALILCNGFWETISGSTGNVTISLSPGVYVVNVNPTQGVAFTPTTVTVIADTPQTVTITGTSTVTPPAPVPAGLCVVYIQLSNPKGGESASLEMVKLPMHISDGQVVKHPQDAVYNSGTKRLVFPDAVPQGTKARVTMDDGRISGVYDIPVASYLEIIAPDT